jgi:two-component system cell cycle response regulator CpdR
VKSRSDGNQGSMFWFTFPYRPCLDIDTSQHGQMLFGKEINVTPSHDSRHILLVDDSLSILKVISRMLTMNGHTVETALDGSIGLKRLMAAHATRDIDMLITDLQMPVMDGIEATSRFRKFENQQNKLRGESRRLLIVGVSASNDTQSKNDGLDAGMDYFLFKPFVYKDLVQILGDETRLPRSGRDNDSTNIDSFV